ncbi:hypothetical protein [Nannocystis radixulma]|uniref:Uncharacterized protein n=1 Tax=Nannocystis radixulma TaxID=2995305 RepID=A0ABT5B7I2_9BACT|nr:hypothetical protein [Nannocystis radixulma]MDC0669610.1 hypothetical protein [Nannocystis radixulma]
MRHTGLAARMIFAERFTAAVIDRPFYAGLRMVATRPRVSEPAPTVVAAEPRPAAPMPRAA